MSLTRRRIRALAVVAFPGFLYCRYRYLLGGGRRAAKSRRPKIEYATPLTESIYRANPPRPNGRSSFAGLDRGTSELDQVTHLGRPRRQFG